MRGQAAGSYPLITLRAGLVRYRQGISNNEDRYLMLGLSWRLRILVRKRKYILKERNEERI